MNSSHGVKRFQRKHLINLHFKSKSIAYFYKQINKTHATYIYKQIINQLLKHCICKSALSVQVKESTQRADSFLKDTSAV